MNAPGNFPAAPAAAPAGMFPPPPPRFESAAALRARAAVRLEMAQQDQVWGDPGARDRNLRAARDLELRADAVDAAGAAVLAGRAA